MKGFKENAVSAAFSLKPQNKNNNALQCYCVVNQPEW